MSNEAAIKRWRDKIAALEQAEAIVSGVPAKFEIQQELDDARLRLSELLQAGVNADEFGWEQLDIELLRGFFLQCSDYDKSFEAHARGEQQAVIQFLEASGFGYHSAKGAFALTEDGILFCARRESIPRNKLHVHVRLVWNVDQKRLQDVTWGSVLFLHHELIQKLSVLWSRSVGDPSERDEFGGEKLISEYPKTAIIEALTNFLIHRDYRVDDHGMINVLEGRVEFINPGMSVIEPETLLASRVPLEPKYCRNARIIEATNMARLNQRAGSGILMIRETLLRNGSLLPDGSVGLRLLNDPERNRFSVAIYRRGLAPTVSKPTQSKTATDISISPTRLRHSTEKLIGREAELKRLHEAWNNPAINLLIIVAWGGVGKTSLVAHWQAELAQRDFDGASYFDWSFYSQGTTEQSSVSSDLFINQALEFFHDPGDSRALPQSAWAKGARLAEWVARRRALLVLDGLEPLQHPPGLMAGHLKDLAMQALLKGLAGKNPGLCIITTRAPIPELDSFVGKTVAYFGEKECLTDKQPKLCSLSTPAGVELLKTLGVRGTAAEFEQLVTDVQGHALTLQLLGANLAEAHGGDIRCHDRVSLEKVDYKSRTDEDRAYGHAFRVMEAYEKWLESGGKHNQRQLAILRLMGFFDRPADPGCLAALLEKPLITGVTDALVDLTEADWNIAVAGLVKLGLVRTVPWEPVRVKGFNEEQAKMPQSMRGEPMDFPQFIRLGVCSGAVLDAHPLLREYFAKRIREQHPNAWTEGHRRLYQHLSGSVPYWREGLEGLQPLYQAVAHGCQARFYDDALQVYRQRILRGIQGPDAFYSTGKLGAISADLAVLACFFDVPWSRVTTAISERRRAWLLNDTGWHLLAIGRLVEALVPLKGALDLREKAENWKFATGVAFNLSDLELALGDLDAAERHAKRAVELADRSGDAFQELEYRAALADVLHQKGQRGKAHEYFSLAEAMEAIRQSECPLLHSRQGFWFCDLLLVEFERASWQQIQKLEVKGLGSEWGNICCKVEQRATQTLLVDKLNRSGLVILALEHLTLGRVMLYQAVLESGEPKRTTTLKAARRSITVAVDGLRAAGTIHELPRGLLTRAWLRFLTGARTGPESAQSDLDEAWEIAARGPMKLHMADIHLYRARLFGMRNAECGVRNEAEKYPWESPQADLAAAEKLINDCGYHRRDEELADAKKAILS